MAGGDRAVARAVIALAVSADKLVVVTLDLPFELVDSRQIVIEDPLPLDADTAEGADQLRALVDVFQNALVGIGDLHFRLAVKAVVIAASVGAAKPARAREMARVVFFIRLSLFIININKLSKMHR